MLWRLLLFLVTAGMGEWVIGPWVPTITYSFAMLQTGCMTLLIVYTTLWYSFDADKNVAKQAYVKVRATLFMLGLVPPLKRELKDDLRDWRARTIKDRLASLLQETLATVRVLRCCLFCIYMPAIDRPLSDCRYRTDSGRRKR